MFDRPGVFARADDRRVCPRCGSPLLTDGRVLWCSFVGGTSKSGRTPGCRFGLEAQVNVEDVPPTKGK